MVIRNRLFLVIDIVVWSVLPVLALALRIDGFSDIGSYSTHLAAFTGTAICFKFASLWIGRLYRRYWSYASVGDLSALTGAILLAGVVTGALYLAVLRPLVPGLALPRSVPILDLMLTLLLTGGCRLSVRYVYHVRAGRANGTHVQQGVIIVGAGDAGRMVARELRGNPQLGLYPVAFVDDDPAKLGNQVHGIPVLGTRKDLVHIAGDLGVREVIIAMPTAPGSVMREIKDAGVYAGFHMRTVPAMFDIISGKVAVSQLREIEIEDLLRRKPVETDRNAVRELVRGATVLVTGAGGSIGSEICRQVANLGARELILLGHGENSLFDIHNELRAERPLVEAIPVVADIRDAARVRRVFDTYRPTVVFHAAAHKHVPLMELNPEEAVTNNVLGTMSILAAAEASGVGRFVFISTDKAVNPVNVMGATKLLAEALVHDVAVRTARQYVSVRFGNVLGSRGSVVPLFRAQIEKGGPVTVTHPEMRRYFMTIPEAVQLVLQAAAMGTGGETFLLDMGEPVRIADLAKDMIQLSGLEVGADIDIVFTGLRPGEKLFEELYSSSEEFERTEHEKVFRLHKNGRGAAGRSPDLGGLFAAASAGDSLRLRQLLGEALPAYDGRSTRPQNLVADVEVSRPSA
jgi:FlaA1/EpsC-like NDP-sugar epimerase